MHLGVMRDPDCMALAGCMPVLPHLSAVKTSMRGPSQAVAQVRLACSSYEGALSHVDSSCADDQTQQHGQKLGLLHPLISVALCSVIQKSSSAPDHPRHGATFRLWQDLGVSKHVCLVQCRLGRLRSLQ